MTYLLVTKPATAPVSLDEAKLFCRVEEGDVSEDDLITALIDAAVAVLDGPFGTLGRCLITQTWDVVLDSFPWQDYYSLVDKGYYPRSTLNMRPGDVRMHQQSGLPHLVGPLQSVTSITYADGAGVQRTLDPANYTVLPGDAGRVVQALNGTWPESSMVPGSVTVRLVAGYGDAADNVPAALRLAIKMMVADWYANRENGPSTAAPMAVDMLLAPYRPVGIV